MKEMRSRDRKRVFLTHRNKRERIIYTLRFDFKKQRWAVEKETCTWGVKKRRWHTEKDKAKPPIFKTQEEAEDHLFKLIKLAESESYSYTGYGIT